MTTPPIAPSKFKPTGAPSSPPPQQQHGPEHDRRLAWIATARGLHRNKRMIGFAGIVLGAALVVWARMSPDQAPTWALIAGFIILGVSWVLFIYIIYDRWRWVKNNPYRPEQPPAA